MRAFLVFLLALAAYAQTDGIITSASRDVTLPPDGAVFTIDVTTSLSTTLDDAVAALKDTGVTAANLIGAGSAFAPDQLAPGMTHEFELSIPYGKAKDLGDKLDAARKALLANNGNLQYSFYVTASESAFQEVRQKLIPELIAEARKKAEFLAAAGDLTLGALLSLNENLYAAPTAVRWFSTTSFSSTSGAILGARGLHATVTASARFAAQPK